MSTLAKAVDQQLTEGILRGLVSKYVHASTNELEIINPVSNAEEVHNVWFAGLCVGFQRTELYFDHNNVEFSDTPEVTYMLMLSDGSAYMLSNNALELRTLDEKEFAEMIAAEHARQAIEAESKQPDNLILFDDKKKLILPEGVK